MSKLKDKVQEFADLAKSLPDNLQAICFELLLRNHLESVGGKAAGAVPAPGPSAADAPPPSPASPQPEAVAKQDDLKAADLHLKAKKFLEKHALLLDHLNNLFFREEGQLKPLYERSSRSTRMSESQIRVTLLAALRTAIASGEFEAAVEQVRQECNVRKCYDPNNFGNNFNNNKGLFDFAKYSKELTTVKLSESGRKQLADLVKELQ